MIWLLLACTNTPETPDSDGDTDTELPDDTQVHTPDGAFCRPETHIGHIALQRYGTSDASFYAQIYDTPSPWIGSPAQETADCAYYSYESVLCNGCQAGQQCSVEGECVDTPRTLKDLQLTVSADGQSSTHKADAQGLIWGQLAKETRFSFTLSGGLALQSEEMRLPEPITPVVTSGGDYDTPGDLSVSWQGSTEGWVQTVIPINHHAGSPTFTTCHSPTDQSAFEVPAAMVNPLAVSTGLEFQGLEHGSYAAVETPAGCVQISVVNTVYTSVEFD
ncbi:MAG: hypothetical protein ACI9VR_001801 [Cognaticolwellia sp.]|jgi:hypothetical protein